MAKSTSPNKILNTAVHRFVAMVILLATSSSVALLLSEGLIRLLAPQPLINLRPDVWMPAGDVGWRLRPNADTRVNTGEREVRWRTDDQGFRIGATPKTAAEMTLVALGDSFVAAMQVEDEDTMIRVLESRLETRSGKALEILNTGVDGWDPNQYRIELGRIVQTRRVNGVLVFVYLGNDIVKTRIESYPPREPVQRHFLRFPRRLDKDEFIDAIAYPVNDFLEVRSHLFILAKNGLRYLLMRVGLTAYYFSDTLLVSETASPRWSVTADVLKEIADMARTQNLSTLFILLPSPEEADIAAGQKMAHAFGLDPATFDLDQAHRLLGAEMGRHGLSVVDATPALREAIVKGIPDVYGRIDNHLGKQGHRVVAEAIEDAVWSTFLLRDPSKKTGS